MATTRKSKVAQLGQIANAMPNMAMEKKEPPKVEKKEPKMMEKKEMKMGMDVPSKKGKPTGKPPWFK